MKSTCRNECWLTSTWWGTSWNSLFHWLFYNSLETWGRGTWHIKELHEEVLYRGRGERQWCHLALLRQRGSKVRQTAPTAPCIKSLHAGGNLCVWTFFFSLSRTSPNPEDLPCELVAGEACIHEELLGLKFRISPHSFFQVRNTKLKIIQLKQSNAPELLFEYFPAHTCMMVPS